MNETNLTALIWLNDHNGFARLTNNTVTSYAGGKQSSRRFPAKIWKGLIREELVARKWVHRSHFELTITAKGKAYLS